MQYKTIALRLIEDRPSFCKFLQQDRRLLTTLEAYARWLKDRHGLWTTFLTNRRPESGEMQIASQALELAIQELVASLPPVSPRNDDHLPSDMMASSHPA